MAPTTNCLLLELKKESASTLLRINDDNPIYKQTLTKIRMLVCKDLLLEGGDIKKEKVL